MAQAEGAALGRRSRCSLEVGGGGQHVFRGSRVYVMGVESGKSRAEFQYFEPLASDFQCFEPLARHLTLPFLMLLYKGEEMVAR